MKPGFTCEGFFECLMSTYWFLETVDFYFHRLYRPVYEEIMEEITAKKLVLRDGERHTATLKA